MTNPVEILIVEDDESIALGLSLNLRMEGYRTVIAPSGEEALVRCNEARPALILLDIGLPTKNGLEVLEELRAGGVETPVIVLSARQDEYDKVAALRLGADDYVTKPFALAELLARVAAVLRRTGGGVSGRSGPVATAAPAGGAANASPNGAGFHFSDVVVDLDTRTVLRGETEVKLTHLEFELLVFFLRQPSRVFSREELLRKVWGAQASSPRTVDNFVAQLRSKLEADPDSPKHFITVRGSGYRFDE